MGLQLSKKERKARRSKLIRAQDDRNERLKHLNRQASEQIGKKATAMFMCPCGRKVTIAWRNLGRERPVCRECGLMMSCSVSCYMKGVMPPAKIR